MYAWLRKGAGQTLLCVMNTQNTAHKKFPLYLKFPCGAEELLNSEASCWNGAATELSLPYPAGLAGFGKEPRLAPFLAGNRRDRRCNRTRGGAERLAGAVRRALRR